jgi:hypothetical protein
VFHKPIQKEELQEAESFRHRYLNLLTISPSFYYLNLVFSLSFIRIPIVFDFCWEVIVPCKCCLKILIFIIIGQGLNLKESYSYA